jgi:hypothetical protein
VLVSPMNSLACLSLLLMTTKMAKIANGVTLLVKQIHDAMHMLRVQLYSPAGLEEQSRPSGHATTLSVRWHGRHARLKIEFGFRKPVMAIPIQVLSIEACIFQIFIFIFTRIQITNKISTKI